MIALVQGGGAASLEAGANGRKNHGGSRSRPGGPGLLSQLLADNIFPLLFSLVLVIVASTSLFTARLRRFWSRREANGCVCR